MAMFEIWLESDLKKPVRVKQLTGNLFSADNQANLVGVKVFNDGEPASLTGGVNAYVVRADGATVTVSGTLTGNQATVILPSTCYAVVGQISIVVKVGTTTVGACTGYVYRSSTDAIVDPGHVIPSIDELLAQIENCRQATTAANNATSSANSAASNANEKAVLANNAATNANDKAGTANSAAQAANAAAGKIDNMTVSATGLASGSAPTASVSEVEGHKHIAFGIPKGDTGNTGATPNIQIGTVSTLNPDQPATVAITGTAENPLLNFGIPKGDTGSADNVYGSTIPMSASDSTTVSQAIAGKVNANQGSANAGKALGIDSTGAVVPVPFSGEDFTGATSSAAGVHGYVPAPAAGDHEKFLKGNGTWSAVPNPQVMTGATAQEAGAPGMVPAPAAGDHGKYLKGDGTWSEVPDPQVMTGATASAAGTSGLVPAPAIAEREKFLCGDGTWTMPEGGKLVSFDLDTVTNTSGSYTHTTVLADVTHDMKAVMIEVSNPDAFNDQIHILTADGSVTLTCDDVAGTSDVTISCLFVANPSPITSSEFDVLANRIGTLASLQTTAKSDLVSAINETVGKIGNVGSTDLQSQVDSLNSKFTQRIQCGVSSYSGLKQGGYSGRITVTVTLPYEMPDVNYFAHAELSDAYADFTTIVCYVFRKTTTSFDVVLVDSASGSTTVNGNFWWVAIDNMD